ncbi:MAG: glutaredoxin family protein [Candidatus Portnoybacteria bacterium]|nr:glutaredoxin family protein [Candidatus Portnoybacteria bacterium]MDD4983136.1 glutaredoxin family protein [Candidatus Portnoybacteria bacterium]
MSKNTITVYSTPTCHYCVMAKEYFKKNNLEFKDVDVSVSEAAAREMIDKSGQMGVPVIEVNGKLVVGFRPDVIEKLLIKD